MKKAKGIFSLCPFAPENNVVPRDRFGRAVPVPNGKHSNFESVRNDDISWVSTGGLNGNSLFLPCLIARAV